jgi:tripartite-type tricarboxylate transporter receptor subunit TctC
VGLPGFEDLPYYGLFAPAGTPPAALEAIAAALWRVLARPDVRERLSAMGLAVEAMTGAQLADRVQAYTETWSRVIRAP